MKAKPKQMPQKAPGKPMPKGKMPPFMQGKGGPGMKTGGKVGKC